jgi:hypothetical protein
MDDADKVGLLAFVVGVEEDRVLHDIGVYLALEHGVVGFETGGEFDVANAIALLLQLGRNTDLELVDIGAGHEPHPEFGLGGL